MSFVDHQYPRFRQLSLFRPAAQLWKPRRYFGATIEARQPEKLARIWDKNSSVDEIANVNIFTTTSYIVEASAYSHWSNFLICRPY